VADRSILYRIRAALQGGKVAVAREIELLSTFTGLFTGATDAEAALQRTDATGIGADIQAFTGSFTAGAGNINTWFGGRQQTRLRCTDNSGLSPVRFTLPGTTDLNTAFDQLVTAGVPEVIRFVIEYTGDTTFLRVEAASGGPVITGTSAIIIRPGVSATVEISRSGSTISDYVFQSIGVIADTTGGTLDSIKLINPATDRWDASVSGPLPSASVIKGNAYRVVNAPTDGSGRFGEVMQDDDWVVWEGETFTAWSTTPHAWFVLPAHEVRRISALEENFLSTVRQSPESSRNTVLRGADYAATAGEIRLKIYTNRSDYSAADLNTTGDIDVYTDASNQQGYLGVRLTGTQASLASVLPTLYAYNESAGTFTLLANLTSGFTHEGNFGAESDYLSVDPISYTAGDSIRIYIGSVLPRYNTPDLDIFATNLVDNLLARIDRDESWFSVARALLSGATVRDDQLAERVVYAEGYSRGVDWRDMSDGVTINANRYIDSDLTITQNGAASFELTDFGAGLQKLISIGLQRNDGNSAEGAMIEIAPSVALVRINTSNNIQFNTTPGSGSETWESLGGGAGSYTLGSGSNNFLVFEIVPILDFDSGNPIPGRWEVVAAFFDGTNWHQANNINLTVSGQNVTGDTLGFSRSANQRGQVTRFSAIKNPGYLTHSELEDIGRHHQSDRWNFGCARQIVAASNREVELATVLEVGATIVLTATPNNTRVALTVDDTDTGNIKLGVVEV
jgi:hypothetical protein